MNILNVSHSEPPKSSLFIPFKKLSVNRVQLCLSLRLFLGGCIVGIASSACLGAAYGLGGFFVDGEDKGAGCGLVIVVIGHCVALSDVIVGSAPPVGMALRWSIVACLFRTMPLSSSMFDNRDLLSATNW